MLCSVVVSKLLFDMNSTYTKQAKGLVIEGGKGRGRERERERESNLFFRSPIS